MCPAATVLGRNAGKGLRHLRVDALEVAARVMLRRRMADVQIVAARTRNRMVERKGRELAGELGAHVLGHDLDGQELNGVADFGPIARKIGDDVILVVAAYDRNPQRLEQKPRVERAQKRIGHVACADDLIDLLAADVLERGFERAHVAVDVGDDGDFQARGLRECAR